jgi:hypothetical protein
MSPTSRTIEEELTFLTAVVDQTLEEHRAGYTGAVRALARLNKKLRLLHEEAESKRQPHELRRRIDAQRDRVRKALGFT